MQAVRRVIYTTDESVRPRVGMRTLVLVLCDGGLSAGGVARRRGEGGEAGSDGLLGRVTALGERVGLTTKATRIATPGEMPFWRSVLDTRATARRGVLWARTPRCLRRSPFDARCHSRNGRIVPVPVRTASAGSMCCGVCWREAKALAPPCDATVLAGGAVEREGAEIGELAQRRPV